MMPAPRQSYQFMIMNFDGLQDSGGAAIESAHKEKTAVAKRSELRPLALRSKEFLEWSRVQVAAPADEAAAPGEDTAEHHKYLLS